MKQENKKSVLVILLADSKKMLEDILSFRIPGSERYVIEATYSGKDAINIIQAHPLDVILLDDAIIETEGEQILSEILKFKSCPVILMTPYTSSSFIPRFMEMGGYGCIKKNFEIDRMHNMLDRATLEESR
ncbi:MAG: response regulator [Candidatus Gracilibacteria bacterium]|nr:response regulator [Candidatus Gracilibacteria bacterium]